MGSCFASDISTAQNVSKRDVPGDTYYSLAASMIASANDGCGWMILATSSSVMPRPIATESSPMRSDALPQRRCAPTSLWSSAFAMSFILSFWARF